MASSLPKDHFLCSICANIFNVPVTTPCGHTFCKSCLDQHWDQDEFCRCPTCNKRFSVRPEMSTNSIIEEFSVQLKRRKLETPEVADVQCDVCTGRAFKADKSCLNCQTSFCPEHLEPHLRLPGLMRHKLIDPVHNIEERICPIHDKALDFYCREEGVCICEVCIETEHQGHDVVCMDEEGVRTKEKIDSRIAQVKMMIEERADKIQQFSDSTVMRNEKAQGEIQSMEAIITKFLKCMQEAKIKVETSIDEKLQAQKERDESFIKELQEEITKLQMDQSELEELMQSNDPLHLLQTLQNLGRRSEMKDWTKTVVCSEVGLETVRRVVSELLDTFQSDLETLTTRESLTFDPATSGRRLVVYDSEKRIKHHRNRPHSVTHSPDRFGLPMVVTRQGFTCGRHYWEVQVGPKGKWDVGVAKESVSRKGVVSADYRNGFYAIDKDDLSNKCKPYKPRLAAISTTIGVFLDYEEGRVSFYDVDKKLHIYSFRGITFTEKLYPYFYLYSKAKKSSPMELSSMWDWRLSNLCYSAKTEEKQEQSGAAETSQPEMMTE